MVVLESPKDFCFFLFFHSTWVTTDLILAENTQTIAAFRTTTASDFCISPQTVDAECNKSKGCFSAKYRVQASVLLVLTSRSLVSMLNSDGMVPDKLLLPIARYSRDVRNPSSVGSVPVSEFEVKLRVWSVVI